MTYCVHNIDTLAAAYTDTATNVCEQAVGNRKAGSKASGLSVPCLSPTQLQILPESPKPRHTQVALTGYPAGE